MEFPLYFSIFRKTRYLIHLTICNEHILNTFDQNCNLITYIMHNFDSFFHQIGKYITINEKFTQENQFFLFYFLCTVWHFHNLGNPIWLLTVWPYFISPNCQNVQVFFLFICHGYSYYHGYCSCTRLQLRWSLQSVLSPKTPDHCGSNS